MAQTYPLSTKDDGAYAFPSDFVDPKEKETPDYGRRYARAIYSSLEYRNHISDSSRGKIIENRKYSEGLQDVDKYKNLSGLEGDTSFLNLDWSQISVVPKVVDVVVGGMINNENSVQCNAVDPNTSIRKEEERKKFYANLLLKEYSEKSEEVTGIAFVPKDEFVPEDQEDLEIKMSLSAKQNVEIAMEELVDMELYNGDWREIEKRIIRDLTENKKGFVRTYFDEENRPRVRYVDILDLITPYTKEPDYKDCQYNAEVVKMSIQDIRRRSFGDLSEEDLFNIARQFAGKNNNRDWPYGDAYYYGNSNYNSGQYEYDDFLVDVLDFWFISTDLLKWRSKKMASNGGYFFDKKGFYADDEDKEGVRNYKKEIDNSYEGFWIIGTEYIFGYGKSKNILRNIYNGKIEGKVIPPWVGYSPNLRGMTNKSLVERIIPHADKMQLYSLKMQHFVAKAAPPGIAFDIDAISNIMVGEGAKKASSTEIIEMYHQLGSMPYTGKNEDGSPRQGLPITPLPNGVADGIVRFVELYNFERQNIRDITGINESRDATQPDTKSLVGIQKLALLASNNATREIYEAYINIKTRVAKNLAQMIQDRINYMDGEEAYSDIIGKYSVKEVDFLDNLKLAQIGIQIEVAPDAEERSILEANIQISLSKEAISIEDAMVIRRIKNIKLAERYLASRTKRRQQMMQQQRIQEAELLSQGQQEAAMVAGEVEIKKQEAEMQKDIAINNNKFVLEEKLEKLKHENKMREIQLQGEIKSEHLEEAAQLDAVYGEVDGNAETPSPKLVPRPSDDPSRNARV